MQPVALLQQHMHPVVALLPGLQGEGLVWNGDVTGVPKKTA
jgi:hypothetical protein